MGEGCGRWVPTPRLQAVRVNEDHFEFNQSSIATQKALDSTGLVVFSIFSPSPFGDICRFSHHNQSVARAAELNRHFYIPVNPSLVQPAPLLGRRRCPGSIDPLPNQTALK